MRHVVVTGAAGGIGRQIALRFADLGVPGYLWSKLGFGAMLTATSLADADMSDLVDRHRPAVNELAAEVFDVAAADGIRLEEFDAFDPASYVRGADIARNRAATDSLVAWLATQSKTRSGIGVISPSVSARLRCRRSINP